MTKTDAEDHRGGAEAHLLLHGGAAPHLLPRALVGPQQRPQRCQEEELFGVKETQLFASQR